MADNEKLDKVESSAEQANAPVNPKKSDKKPQKKAKPGLFARIAQWAKETKAELKKVQWPTWKQTANNTLIVLAFCVAVGICIFLFDKLAGGVFAALVNLFHG